MRALVVTTPGAGHVVPVAPVALGLREAGHEVLWATGRDGTERVASLGVPTVEAGLDQPTRMRRFGERWPTVLDMPPEKRRAVVYPALFAHLAAPAMYRDLLTVVDAFPPDVVVHEPCELAAVAIARRFGVPNVCVGFGRFIPPELLTAAAEVLDDLWSGIGVAVPEDLGLYDHLYLHPLPRSIEPSGDRSAVQLLRPVRATGPLRPPGAGEGSRPRVYVTFGTEFAHLAPWGAVVAALGDLGVDALLTTGNVDPESLGALPEGVEARHWVPQSEAVESADLVVSHGGSGAMLGAIAAGRPQLVIPLGADHFDNARLVADCHLGSVLGPGDVSADAVATALDRLHHDDLVAASTDSAARDMAAMPGPEHAVQLIEMQTPGP